MQTLETTVTNQAGISITVTTQRNDGESLDDWISRHLAAVAAAQASGGPA